MILFIKHIDIEGPGTLGAFFKGKGYSHEVIDLSQGQSLPEKLEDFQAVVSLGGPMNVYEEDRYPFLKQENIFLQQVLAKKVPFLGLCLGSQLLAKASGAKVAKSPEKEIGFFPIKLTEEGERDLLFQDFNREPCVFQWHDDMFFVPPNGVLLARSDQCPFQAFRIGDNAYGLQFHLEITQQDIQRWAEAYFPKGNTSLDKKKEQMIREYQEKQCVFAQSSNILYNNFLSIIENT